MGDKTAATPPKRGAAHERLSDFIGKWHAEASPLRSATVPRAKKSVSAATK